MSLLLNIGVPQVRFADCSVFPAFAAVFFSVVALSGAASVPLRAETAEVPRSFAMDLVAAARQQRAVLAIYDPSYRKLDYPMGDVPWYIGVCTDVVVRAYRQLGIDLQQLVHKSRLGSGDRNIDHRRVRVLKKFFTRKGTRLKVSDNPENYKPGDLVTYYLPKGTFSKTHIAIVSDRKTASGVPLVIHNIGYGVSEEDWLFGSKITGHYRYEAKPNIKGWKK
jgi:uncharacterized protein